MCPCLCQWGAVPGLQGPYDPPYVWGRLYMSNRDFGGLTVCLPVPDGRVWMAKCVPISEMEALGVSLCVSW